MRTQKIIFLSVWIFIGLTFLGLAEEALPVQNPETKNAARIKELRAQQESLQASYSKLLTQKTQHEQQAAWLQGAIDELTRMDLSEKPAEKK